MTSPRDLPDHAAMRPVALRMRPDLSIHAQRAGQRRTWVVKDPVALTYFHLRDEEHAILQMLDGRTSLAEIKRQFERAFAPMQISLERIQSFLTRLHDLGLILAEASGQGRELLLRNDRRRRSELVRALTGLLAVRFRGVDPEPLLSRLYPKCRWIFSPWCLVFGVVVALAAATLVSVQFNTLQSKLPDYHAFFSLHNIAWLAVALAAAKVLHELGHALTCKHFGGECHEIGIMLLVFTPCLYCNVSAAWMFRNRWRRIGVSAAGIVVEIVLASVCTLLWWVSEPGLLNTLCLNVMVIASVGTLLLNGNPLLRYDGYYILSDLVEIPNLAQQSRAALRHFASRLFLGTSDAGGPDLPRRRRVPLALYALASTAYRICLVVAILWMLKTVLAVHHLEVLAYTLAIVVVLGMALPAVRRTVRFVSQPYGREPLRRWRMATVLMCLLIMSTAVLFLPVPTYVAAPAVLEYDQAERVFVPIDGTLRSDVSPGQTVRAGDPLARLENLDLDLEVARLTAERDSQQLLLRNLEARRTADPTVAQQIPAAREALAGLSNRLEQLKSDHRRLTLTAPIDGAVLPSRRRRPPTHEAMQLARWHGGPLDSANRGCYLETGTLLCLVGDPQRFRADVVIDQSDVDRVRVGQSVRVRLDQLPGTILHGTVEEIAKIELAMPPRELTATRRLAVRDDTANQTPAIDIAYQARVRLDDAPAFLTGGTAGEASVTVASETLGRRLARYLARTFRVEL